MANETVDLSALASGGDSGVANDDVLTAFAEAALGTDGDALAEARDNLASRMGEAAVTDSAAIVATFQKMTRVADSTGIPLDAIVEMASRDLREQIGVNSFTSARNTPTPPLLQQVAAKLLGPMMTPAMKLMARMPKSWLTRLYRL